MSSPGRPDRPSAELSRRRRRRWRSRVRACGTGCARRAAAWRLRACGGARSARDRCAMRACGALVERAAQVCDAGAQIERGERNCERRRSAAFARHDAFERGAQSVCCCSMRRRNTAARARKSKDAMLALARWPLARSARRRRRPTASEEPSRRAADGDGAPEIQLAKAAMGLKIAHAMAALRKAGSASAGRGGAGARRCGGRIPGASGPRFPRRRKEWARAGRRQNRRW